jgi:inosine/xanthosine triphosphatase
MKVVVASKSFSKVQATKIGFEKIFGESPEIVELEVDTGISAMPLSSEEMQRGAYNRTQHALELYSDADYWVGIEGGFTYEHGAYYCSTWVCIFNKEQSSFGRTMSFPVPKNILNDVLQGEELGDVIERIGTISRSNEGLIGLCTNNSWSRIEFNVGGVVSALVPFSYREE